MIAATQFLESLTRLLRENGFVYFKIATTEWQGRPPRHRNANSQFHCSLARLLRILVYCTTST